MLCTARAALRRFESVSCRSILVRLALTTWGLGAPLAAVAGPNQSGALLLHTDPAVSYTSDGHYEAAPVPDCDAILTELPPNRASVVWILAAFSPTVGPRLSGAAFALQYDRSELAVLRSGGCGDQFAAGIGWPSPGSGVSVAFDVPRQTTVVPLAWVAVDTESGVHPVALSVAPHPQFGAVFWDDSIPSQVEAVPDLGALGIATPGTAPCPPRLGACCLPGCGTNCTLLSAAACAAGAGVYSGDDVPCGPQTCPAYGACCTDDTRCVEVPERTCLQGEGEFLGHYTTCYPNPCIEPGACCTPGDCVVTSPENCQTIRGIFRGQGTTCTPTICDEVGACCGPSGLCEFTKRTSCRGTGYQFFGGGDGCDPSPCPPLDMGACCRPDGHCFMIIEGSCPPAFQWMGLDSDCSPNPCPQPTGRCCLSDHTCLVTTRADCTQRGGSYGGNNSVCSGTSCRPSGACCLPTHCAYLMESSCITAGGTFMGPNVPCETGCPEYEITCCLPDGSCTRTLPSTCSSSGGALANGECDEWTCAFYEGSCCLPTGGCVVVQPPLCIEAGGVFLGFFQNCSGVQCDSSYPVTWLGATSGHAEASASSGNGDCRFPAWRGEDDATVYPPDPIPGQAIADAPDAGATASFSEWTLQLTAHGNSCCESCETGAGGYAAAHFERKFSVAPTHPQAQAEAIPLMVNVEGSLYNYGGSVYGGWKLSVDGRVLAELENGYQDPLDELHVFWDTLAVGVDHIVRLEAWVSAGSNMNHEEGIYTVTLVGATRLPADAQEAASTPLGSPTLSIVPNPIRTRCLLRITPGGTPDLSTVPVSIFDAGGREVQTLQAERAPSGNFEAHWDGTRTGGTRLPAGIYYARTPLTGGGAATKLILLR